LAKLTSLREPSGLMHIYRTPHARQRSTAIVGTPSEP
jgi:hypothetical protein